MARRWPCLAGRIVVAFTGSALALWVFLGGIAASGYPERVNRFIEAKAEVVVVNPVRNRGSVSYYSTTVVYQPAPGQRYRGRLKLLAPVRRSDVITIRYNPDNPREIAATEKRSWRIVPYLIVTVLILMFTIVFVVVLPVCRKDARI